MSFSVLVDAGDAAAGMKGLIGVGVAVKRPGY